MKSIILTTVAFLLSTTWLAAQSELNTTVKVTPLGSSCLEVVNFGGTTMVERAGSAGVQIAIVPALHDNGIPNSLLPILLLDPQSILRSTIST